MKKQSKQLKISLPFLLLVTLCVIMVIIVFTQARAYGITMDEPLQDQYGVSILHWYTSLGRDTSFLNYTADTYMPEHGAIFDALVALAQQILGHHWYTRAVMTGLAGVAGVVAVALCGYEISGTWGALLAALGLWLYPRYFGAMWNNPKDVPFAAAMTWILWAVILLVKHWKSRRFLWYCVLVGFCIGFAASIRVTAVIWYGILAVFFGSWWVINGVRCRREKQIRSLLIKQVMAAMAVGLVSLLTMIAFWPYIFISPFAHLYRSVIIMSRFPWNGNVLFNGVIYPAMNLPRIYAPAWLIIGSPLPLVLCLIVGAAYLFKKRLADPVITLVFFAFVIPLASLVILHAALYGALRQFLFLVPPMILIAVYGVVEVLRLLIAHRRRFIATGLVLLLLASYAFVVAEMVSLHPYEYIYFNPIVGGLPGSANKYELDYWASCDRASAQWLAQHYQQYTTKHNPSVQGITYFEQLIMLYLPGNFYVDTQQPDFYVAPTWENDASSAYRVIHVESIENIPLCVVEVKDE
ncbi:MAG TPA: hypothetical protein VF043_34445 [Ktedonobacteraceae bacterium]